MGVRKKGGDCKMKYEVIATGSSGNCIIINDEIALDIGVTFKQIKSIYKKLRIVLLTHIHS